MTDSQPQVLVTGATGFIGSRLVPALLAAGYRVRCLVRRPDTPLPAGAEQAVGDLLEHRGIDEAMTGVDTAYYLVHSLAGGRAGFERRDRRAAGYFTECAERAGIRRVIYLGGLGEADEHISNHLQSRNEVATILRAGGFLTTVLRAAVIIGAGGASFEMIRALVERLPLMVAPRWVDTRCQPIAVNDVISYLCCCLADDLTAGQTLDIGGPEVLTYRQMMKRFGTVHGRVPVIIPVPVLTPKLSSYWVGLITPVSPSISMPLIEGLATEVICHDQRIREFCPVPLTPYDEAVRIALADAGISG